MRRVLAAIAIVFACSRGVSAQGTSSPPPPIPEVTLNLSNRTTGGVLPFDTPFAFTSTVPDRLRRVEVLYAIVDDFKNATLTAAGVTLSSGNWENAGRPLVWTRDPITTVVANNTIPLRIVVPALEAKKFYVFSFAVEADVATQDVTDFRRRARNVLETRFAAIPTLNILQSDFLIIRDRLIQELKAVAGPNARLNAPGTPLDPAATWNDVGDDFKQLLTTGVANEIRLRTDVPLYAGGVAPAAGHLRRALPAAALVIANLAEVPAEHTDAAAFASLGALAIVRVANGADPAAPVDQLPLPAIPTVEEVDSRLTGYHKTAALLHELVIWMRQLDRDDILKELVTNNKITLDERTQLTSSSGALAQAEQAVASLVADLSQVRREVIARATSLTSVTDLLNIIAVSTTVVSTSTLGNYDTFARYHVAADAGILYASEIDSVVPYGGANFYLRPVNRDVSLDKKSSFGRRASITLALTYQSIAEEETGRSDLFGTQALVVGGGYRIHDILRLGAGVLVFRAADANPFVSSSDLTVTPYAALSFDFSLAQTFQGLKSLFD